MSAPDLDTHLKRYLKRPGRAPGLQLREILGRIDADPEVSFFSHSYVTSTLRRLRKVGEIAYDKSDGWTLAAKEKKGKVSHD